LTKEENKPAVFVARGASYLLIQNVASAGIQILAFAIIARLISQVDMGLLTVFTLITSLASISVGLGLPSAAIKYIAEFLGKGDRAGASGVAFKILKNSFLLSIPAALFIFFLSDYISLSLLETTVYSPLFKVLALDVFAVAILPCLQSSLIGAQKVRETAILMFLKLGLRQILIVAFLLYGFGLFGIVVAWVIGDLIAVSIYIAAMLKFLGAPVSRLNTKHLLKFSYPLYLSDVVNFLYSWFDRVVLLAFLSLSELGIYSVSLKAFGVLESITLALSTTLFTKYSEMHGRMGIGSVEKAITTSSRYICYVVTPLAFGMLAVASPALSLFAGESYVTGYQPLMILSFFLALTSISASLAGLLMVLGETLIILILTAANVGVGIVIGMAIIPFLGVIGASLLRGIAMIISLTTAIWVLKKKMNLTFDKEAFWKSIMASSIMALVIIAIQFSWYNLYLLPLYVGLAVLVYMGMLKVLRAIRKEDINLLRQYFGRFEFVINPIEAFFLKRTKL
jgi:O-antigen/teichoic acid export membrane protein